MIDRAEFQVSEEIDVNIAQKAIDLWNRDGRHLMPVPSATPVQVNATEDQKQAFKGGTAAQPSSNQGQLHQNQRGADLENRGQFIPLQNRSLSPVIRVNES